ncbi:aldolase/citrate lyase family protein [Conexibacter stalactiti]|uniref:Aldolase/citrate lyase family protein n=1 Tax=Conexibacter stalactiti TaxID=1940611 RepID=A0ABU4HKG8_9ACTN|nr:aldolase/citrate lyase family protein [Conexibacter stalactiti]MDW5593045.1 aldolase/citrate lyase family protein [Conexibacter stalactiti]MEC5033686.1 aldolase/citrate lyase family protein [Conexibacter stalactiti]
MPDTFTASTNALREKLTSGSPVFGTFCSIPHVTSAEALGGAGFDFVLVDAQHGAPTFDTLVQLIPAIQLGGAPSLIRLPWNDPALAMRALDLGAAGVVVPLISTRQDAERAATACRYPPSGIRSFGQVRGLSYGSTAATNDEVLCIAMIETAEGLENADAIASTPGVDGIFIGPVDLALSMGLPVDFTLSDPRLKEAMTAILEAGQRHDCPVGMPLFGIGMASGAIEAGYRFMTAGGDGGYIRMGAMGDITKLREIADGENR